MGIWPKCSNLRLLFLWFLFWGCLEVRPLDRKFDVYNGSKDQIYPRCHLFLYIKKKHKVDWGVRTLLWGTPIYTRRGSESVSVSPPGVRRQSCCRRSDRSKTRCFRIDGERFCFAFSPVEEKWWIPYVSFLYIKINDIVDIFGLLSHYKRQIFCQGVWPLSSLKKRNQRNKSRKLLHFGHMPISPHEWIFTKFGVECRLADIIICAKFLGNQFKIFYYGGGSRYIPVHSSATTTMTTTTTINTTTTTTKGKGKDSSI